MTYQTGDDAAKERAVSLVGSLPLTQAMIVEVLAARHRLGEPHWPFRNQPGLHVALNELARRDLIEFESGVVGGTKRAMLTKLGRLGAMSATYGRHRCDSTHTRYGRCELTTGHAEPHVTDVGAAGQDDHGYSWESA